MSEPVPSAPAPGWYPDPGAMAAFRWWDGAHWTPATLDHPPTQGAGSPPATPRVLATSEPAHEPHAASPGTATSAGVPTTPLPTRRSLRAGGVAPATATTPTGGPAAPATAASGNGASSRDPAYRPINPLVCAERRSPATPVSPPGFTVPAAWAANAPSVPATPGFAVGVPNGAASSSWSQTGPGVSDQRRFEQTRYNQAEYDRAASGRGAAVRTWSGSTGNTRAEPTNTAARLGLTFPLLVLAGGVVTGFAAGGLAVAGALDLRTATMVATLLGVVAFGLVVAGIPLSIVGLVRASGYVRQGFRARGRAHAIVGLMLCVLMLGRAVAVGVAAGIAAEERSSTSVSRTLGAEPVHVR